MSIIDSTFRLIEINEARLEAVTTTPSDAIQPANHQNGDDGNHTLVVSGSDPPVPTADPEATPTGTPKPSHAELSIFEGLTKPEELIGGCKDLLEQLVKEDGLKDRGVHLALLHVEKKVRARAEAQGVQALLFVVWLGGPFTDP